MPLLSNQPIIYHLHLDDRRFEEFVRDLYYQDIQEKIVNNKFDDVVLLSGNKEQGRDCVLYKNGNSVGMSQSELGQFMVSLGADTVLNLDGGGSSTLYFNGQVINKPTTGGNKISERAVSDIVYIGY